MHSRGLAGFFLGTALVVALVAGCSDSSSDLATVTDDPGWSDCVSTAGGETGTSPGDDQAQQLEFWAVPQHLRCAVEELEPDQLDDAVDEAFADPESADDFVSTAQGQQTAIRQLATDVAAADGEDAATVAVRKVLEAGYDGDADDSSTVRTVAALAIVQTLDGTDDYDRYLERSGQSDGVDALTRYADDVVASGPDALRERLRSLEDRMIDVTG